MTMQITSPISVQESIQPQKILHGKRFLIVLASYFGKLHIYQQMHALGVKMVVIDGPDHWAEAYVETGLFEAFLEIDPNNLTVASALAVVEAYPAYFDAVVTFDDYANRLTAGLAKAMNCVGHPEEVVNLNKFEVRQVCQKAGLSSPRFALINSEEDLLQAALTVGFPSILKPVRGASSLDVFRVDTYDALKRRHYAILQKRKINLLYESFNSDTNNEGRFIWKNGFTMVLEEYIDGDEYDIDCLLSFGELVYASVTEEKPQPMMIETGAQLPTTCCPQQEAELIQLAQETLFCLGYTEGVFHVEAKYGSHGPQLIEVNPRMGGGTIYQMNKLVWGVDLVKEYLHIALNHRIQPSKQAPQTYLSSHIWDAPYSGTVIRDDFLEHLENEPNVVFCKTYVIAGEQVDGPETLVPGWLGEIIVCGDTRKAADQHLERIVAQLPPPSEIISPKTVHLPRCS